MPEEDVMLRDFFRDPWLVLPADYMVKYDLPHFETPNDVFLLSAVVLTPDSFAWTFCINNKDFYCMYAEDYVPNIEHVISEMNSYLDTRGSVERLIPVHEKERQIFEESSPVLNASVYEKGEGADEMMNYATTSGLDFVFIAKINLVSPFFWYRNR